HGFGSLNGYTASGFAAVYPRRESRRHLPPPRNAMPRLTDWLDDPAAASPLLQSLRPHAARLPACAEEARVLQVLELLQALRADQDVLAAAILHGWPALRAAVPKQARSAAPRLPALLEGLAAADQVHGLHQGRPGHANAEGLRRLLLALVRDLRAVLVLLAEQLVRLRDAAALPEAERRHLAELAADIHAPLANRLGIWQ